VGEETARGPTRASMGARIFSKFEPPLQRKIHAAQKVLKARVGAERIEGRIDL
jgi:hypothetical protein